MRMLYLIRHGKPDFPGGETVCLGRTDLPLGELGRLQSALCGAYLEDAGLTAVYCSRLARSRQTAEYLNAPVVELPGLEELDAGDWDGLTFSEIRERWPELFEARRTDPSLQPPGAEERERGLRRFVAAVDRALEESRGDVAVVAHASVLQLFLCAVLGLPLESARSLPLPYGSVTPVQFENGSFLPGGVVAPRPELTEDICLRLLAAADAPPELVEHCAAVSREAMRVVCALAAAGVYLDPERVYAAARLHDLARRREDHALRGGELLSALGYPEVGGLVRLHHDLGDAEALSEAAAVFIADKTVRGAERVTLSERFEKSRLKCGDPEALAAWEKRYAQARRVAEGINSVCGREIIV